MDKITENPDGTLRIQGTGIHFKERGGPRATGLWILTLDLIDGYICSRLGPSA